MSQSRVGEYVMIFIISCPATCFPNVLKYHLGENLEVAVKEFQLRWAYPQYFGTSDGFHRPITAPVDFHADYYIRKGWYSILLQATVDSSYRFIDIHGGWP